MFAGGMWVFYLEAALALCLLVFIVWWTLPKQPPKQPPEQERSDAAGDSAARRANKVENADENAGNNKRDPN